MERRTNELSSEPNSVIGLGARLDDADRFAANQEIKFNRNNFTSMVVCLLTILAGTNTGEYK
jgi:hypothetical protein